MQVKPIVSTADADEGWRSRYDSIMGIIGNGKKLKWFTREWREAKGMSQDKVAELLDTNRGQISKLERGDLRMNDDWISGIAAALNIDPSDLFRNPAVEIESQSRIPLISWVSAGEFQAADAVVDASDCRMIEIADLPDGDWFALTVDGDSMDRISPPGSTIVVNRKDRRLIPNGCYIIANEQGEATYKRYRPSPDRFEPVSVNPAHEPIFPDGAVRVIGRVRRSILEM